MVTEYTLHIVVTCDTEQDRDDWFTGIKNAVAPIKPSLPVPKLITAEKTDRYVPNKTQESW